MPTVPEWDHTVLEHTYDHVDYVSIHTYYGDRKEDTGNYLAKTVEMDEFITSVVSVCDAVKATKKRSKTLHISFDEWNVWYQDIAADNKREPWQVAPPQFEDIFAFDDALLVGCMIITLLKHADRVKIACLAQLVNVIAPITTVNGGGCWRQTTYYPFQHASNYARGAALDLKVQSPVYEDKEYGEAPCVEAVAAFDEATQAVTILAVNRSLEKAIELTCDVRDFAEYDVAEHITMTSPDISARNTMENPDNVVPMANGDAVSADGYLKATLPALSWNVLRLSKDGAR
jgi:alpha-N-arabinofuranosidase